MTFGMGGCEWRLPHKCTSAKLPSSESSRTPPTMPPLSTDKPCHVEIPLTAPLGGALPVKGDVPQWRLRKTPMRSICPLRLPGHLEDRTRCRYRPVGP